MAHYRANVNYSSAECFKHFDNEERMFAWISEQAGEKITSFEECEKWTEKQRMGYIEVLELFDLKDFYAHRREYVTKLRQCDDLMQKAQRMEKSLRRDRVLIAYSYAYEDANQLYGLYPEVWQGEI